MKRIRVICCAAAAALAAAGAAYSAAPASLSYQGTLRKDGRLFNGTAAMEFRITDQAGVTEYWTSGSTDVAVSTGLFRYALGSPNEAQFASIVWKDIAPYVQMKLEGSWLPPEPLYSSAYSMHALTAESSTGTFTVNDGSLKITGAAGANGVVFPNGTVQYGAPGWEVSVNGIYTSFPGRAGVGVSTPSFSLDVKGGPGDAYVQLWRDSSETIVASMSATGQLYADAAMLRNMPSGNVVDTLAATLAAGNNAGGTALVNVGSITVASALGAGLPRVYLAPGVEISSAPQAAYGGVQISTNVYLPPGAKYYGDGSGLTGVNAADNLGDHTASQPLDMSGFAVVGASAVVFSPEVALSSGSAAQYGGLLVSTNVYLPAGAKYYGDGSGLTGIGAASGNLVDNLSDTLGAGNNAGGYSMLNVGNLALGAAAAGTRLDVQGGGGGYTQFWRNSGGVIVASMTDTGVIYADASKMRGLPAADNLGDHTLAQNLLVGAYWLSGDGGNEGVSVNASGNVGVGVNPATARLEVNDADANTLTSGMKFTNFACSGSDKLTVDGSGNLVCSVDQTGSGTGNLVDNLTDTLNSGRDAGGFGITGLGNVAIGAATAGTRLDVQGGGGGYTQFWRDSGGVIVASMTDTGVIYADASKMRGLPSADNLGDHTLAQNLRAGTYWLSGDGGNEGVSVNASGNVGVGVNPATARFEVNDADADTATSGMKFTNFSCSGTAKLTVDVSGNLVCASDQLGSNVIDTLSATLNAGNDAGGLNIVNAGMITAGGQLTVYSSATVTGASGLGSPRLRLASNVEISSAPASAYGGVRVSTNIYAAGGVYASKFYGDGSQLTNIPTGNVVDSLSATLGVDNDAGGTGMVNLGGVGIGIVAPGASLDVKGGGGLAQLWRSPAGVVVASMTDSGVLYADASGMRNLPSGGGGNVVDTLADTLGAGNNAGGASMLNVGNLALGSGAAGTRLDVQGGGGGYTQFWRDSGGVIVASMTDTGVIYADASKMRGLPAADNLGDHTLAQNLLVGAYWLSGDGGNEGV
ncbi:MAG: hypothetical protein M0025_12625, partial [Elusimicrobia bacterium]|nr:hypothetical protein [Elusimicrobiota bacterium]